MFSLQNHLLNTLVYLKDTLEQRDEQLADRKKYFSVEKSAQIVNFKAVNNEDCVNLKFDSKSTESDEKAENMQATPKSKHESNINVTPTKYINDESEANDVTHHLLPLKHVTLDLLDIGAHYSHANLTKLRSNTIYISVD